MCASRFPTSYTMSAFFFSSRRRHTRSLCDWSSDVCSSDLFTPNTQANEAIRNGIASPACSPFRSSVNTTKTRCLEDQVACSQEALSLCFSFKHKADDEAIVLHLSNGKRISRVLGKARIANKLHLRSRCEQPGYFQCVLALSFQAHV